MSRRPLRKCKHPACRELVRETYCDRHKKEKIRADRARISAPRPSAHQRGYTGRWSRARTTYLRNNPLCKMCAENDLITAATVVDHIVPHKGDQELFWDTSNWQPLCKACHDHKTFHIEGNRGFIKKYAQKIEQSIINPSEN